MGNPSKEFSIKWACICLTEDLNFKDFTSEVMICSAVMSSLHMGTLSFKKGKFLPRTALTYMDLLKIPPTAKETKRAKMIGRNKLTFSVVSSMIIARENESLEYPASVAAAPMIAYVEG